MKLLAPDHERDPPHRRRLTLVLGLGAALALAACRDDVVGPQPTQPLEIASVSPAPDAVAVETGAGVAVVFNQAIDPATLTPTTFRVKRDGVMLATAVRYDLATRTARAVAPFLPAASYEVEVTAGVRTPGMSALGAPRVWSFTTGAWHLVTVTVDAEGIVGLATSLAVDGRGRVHVSYWDGTNGTLKYAICAAGCDAAAGWREVTVDAGFVGAYSDLAVDGSGRVHVSYFDGSNEDLKYATCATACDVAGSWQAVTVDAAGSVGLYSSLAVDGSGRLHVSYWDGTNGDLKYASCAAGCAAAANWRATTVDAPGLVGLETSLAADGNGHLYVSYAGNGGLKYAACAASCDAAASWRVLTVDASGEVGQGSSLAVDEGGRVHVSYSDGANGDLKYANCAAACTAAAGWQVVTVDAAGLVGLLTSVGVDGSGRLHVSYLDGTNGDLKYATCAADCGAGASWQAVAVDAAGFVGAHSSLAVDQHGRVHISYWDETNQDLKYIE